MKCQDEARAACLVSSKRIVNEQVIIPDDVDTLKIVYFPDPVLKHAAHPISAFDSRVGALARRMLELMRHHEGVGLAAPQVGLGLRLFVCNATGEPADDMVCANPRFIELNGAEKQSEGCLSIPNVNVTMRRALSATIEAFDVEGHRFRRTGEGLLARVWQHETDHLDGRLIIDAMSPTDELANRRIIKQLKDDYTARTKRTKRP